MFNEERRMGRCILRDLQMVEAMIGKLVHTYHQTANSYDAVNIIMEYRLYTEVIRYNDLKKEAKEIKELLLSCIPDVAYYSYQCRGELNEVITIIKQIDQMLSTVPLSVVEAYLIINR